MNDDRPTEVCSWCGADIAEEVFAGTTERAYRNRRGEVFCRPDHRTASNRALRRLVERPEAAR